MSAPHTESNEIVTFPGIEMGSVTDNLVSFTTESGLEHEDHTKSPTFKT